jgi:hypothetical protein
MKEQAEPVRSGDAEVAKFDLDLPTFHQRRVLRDQGHICYTKNQESLPLPNDFQGNFGDVRPSNSGQIWGMRT